MHLLRIYKVDVRQIYYASVGIAASYFDGNINQDAFLQTFQISQLVKSFPISHPEPNDQSTPSYYYYYYLLLLFVIIIIIIIIIITTTIITIDVVVVIKFFHLFAGYLHIYTCKINGSRLHNFAAIL